MRKSKAGPDRLRIVIIEENFVTSELLAAMVRRSGHEVVVVRDANTTSRELRKAAADVVLMNLELSRVGGIELLRRVRRDHPALAIVGMPRQPHSDVLLACAQAGVRTFVGAPFDVDELPAILAETMRSHAAARRGSIRRAA
jgi:two-component system nitrogen regulation response regulator NtrX